ncbi:flavin reductase [Anaeromicrobium sediminis]|uniref:Flavin reductase n=1 Tax=Anaeromicrobium sediminis TaxID=1478221 RepID=A0A267MJS1_9FIRM|nr:flavin reductase [Anaeromicrobium sediminis]PAB59844.1 flavin reductase [Anaeromicrobium sediminis]
MDTKAFFKLSYGLYIVSSCHEDKQSGCVVNTLSQVTSKPAKLSVTISKDNFTEQIIEKSGYFAAIALTQNAEMDLIGEFGFKKSETVDKFAKFNSKMDEKGIKYITDSAAARYSCKVINKLDLGTHIMFIGEVLEAEVLSEDKVMTYAYYHKVKKGITPKNSPSYKEETGQKGYRCKICGYVLEAEEVPEDFICPICGRGHDQFEKL